MGQYEIKNCNIMKPCTDAFQASSAPHKLSRTYNSVFILYTLPTCLATSQSHWFYDRLYIALLSAPLSRLTALACGSTWVTSFVAPPPFFKFIYPPKWCTYSAGMAGATWNCSRLGASPVHTIQPCHFKQSHIHKVYACLAVTCHLHFWQNDRDLLCATAVTQAWNRYRNKSQHRKSTLEKKFSPAAPAGIQTPHNSTFLFQLNWSFYIMWPPSSYSRVCGSLKKII